MDISALFALTQGKAPTQGGRAGGPSDVGFTQTLQAVTSRHRDIASTAREMPTDAMELPATEPGDTSLALAPVSDGVTRAIDSLIDREPSLEPVTRFAPADGSESSPLTAGEMPESVEAEDALSLVRERMALIQQAGQPPAAAETAFARLAAGDPAMLPSRTLQATAGGMPTIDTATANHRSAPGAELLLDPAESRTVSATVSREPAVAAVATGDGPSSVAPANAQAPTLPGTRISTDGDIMSTSGRAPSTGFADPGLTPPPSGTAIHSTAPAGTANAPAGAALTAPLASPPWGQQLGQQLVGLAQRGDQRVELRINPAELGPLSVSLKMSENGAQAHFLSNHLQVRTAVEQAIPQLREALEEQGITLGEAMVGEHPQGQQERPAFAERGPAAAVPHDELSSDAEVADSRQAPRLDGRVDLYA